MVPGGGGVSRDGVVSGGDVVLGDGVVSGGDVVLGDGVVLGLAVLGTFVGRANEGKNTKDRFKSIYKHHT